MNRIALVVSTFVASSFAVGGFACSSSSSTAPPASDGGTDGSTASVVTGITIANGDLVPAFSPTVTDYEVTSLTTLVPTSITVAGADATIAGTHVTAGTPYQTTLTALDDATVIAVEAKDAQGNPVTYKIHTNPKDRPTYTTSSVASPKPGLIYLTPIPATVATLPNRDPNAPTPSYLYIVDASGVLKYYKKVPAYAFDFKPQKLANGTVRYTYIVEKGDPGISSTTNPCTVVVMDDKFTQLKTYELLATAKHPAFGADVHDFLLLDDDHYILESYLEETVTNVPSVASQPLVTAVVQEVQGGQVVFDWDSKDLPELYTDTEMTLNGSGPSVDYVHLNSIAIDPSNQNLVVSLRYADELLELDRKTAAVVWKLGGKSDQFGLAAADKSSHQHDASFLGQNHLLMFDNGSATSTTKIREYQIDPTGHAATVLAAMPVDTHYSVAMGSVQKIDNSYFIGWGVLHSDDTAGVTEIDATTKQKSFELTWQLGYASYRAFKFQ